MELDGEAVEVANVQRAEIMMEGVVEESIINSEVAWWILALGRCVHSSTCPSPGGARWLGVWEESIGGRRVDVGGEIQAI
jgi:hypothetical protein